MMSARPPFAARILPPLKKGAGACAAGDGGFAFDLDLAPVKATAKPKANPPQGAAHLVAPFFKGGYRSGEVFEI